MEQVFHDQKNKNKIKDSAAANEIQISVQFYSWAGQFMILLVWGSLKQYIWFGNKENDSFDRKAKIELFDAETTCKNKIVCMVISLKFQDENFTKDKHVCLIKIVDCID